MGGVTVTAKVNEKWRETFSDGNEPDDFDSYPENFSGIYQNIR